MQEIRPRFFCDFIFFQVFAFFIMKKGGNAGNPASFFLRLHFFQVFAFFIMKEGGNAGNVGRPAGGQSTEKHRRIAMKRAMVTRKKSRGVPLPARKKKGGTPAPPPARKKYLYWGGQI